MENDQVLIENVNTQTSSDVVPSITPEVGPKVIKEVEAPKQKKKRRKWYWWRYILVFLFGVVTTVVAEVAGIIYATVAIKMSDIEKWTGQDGKLFTEEYRNLSALGLVLKFLSGETNINSLEGISQITPFIDNTLVGYLEQIGLTREDYQLIAKYQFDQFGSQEFINSLVSNIKLSTLFTPERLGSQALADAFSKYPSDAEDAIDGKKDFTIQNILNNELYQNDIKFDQGKGKSDYNGQYIKFVVDNITIDSVMTINDNDMLAFLKGVKIADIQTKFKDTTFGQIVGSQNTTGLMATFKDIKLGEFIDNPEAVLNRIELKDAFSLDGMSGSTRALLETLFYQPGPNKIPASIGWLTGKTGEVNNMQLVVDEIKLQDVLSLDNMDGTAKKLLETLFYQPNTNPKIPTSIGWLQGKTGETSNMQLIMDEVKLQDVIDTGSMDTNTKAIIETLFKQPGTDTPISLGWLGGKTNDVANAKTLLDNIKLVDAFGIDRNKIEEQIEKKNNGEPDPGYGFTSIQMILCYEAYTSETAPNSALIGERDPNKPRTIAGLQGDKLDSTIKDFKVSDIMTIDQDNPLLVAIQDTKVFDLSDKINTLTLTEVVPSKYLEKDSPDYNKILASLASKEDENGNEYTFLNLSKAVDQLTIGDYLEVKSDSHPIIKWLVEDNNQTPLTEIGSVINDVPLNRIVEDKYLHPWVSMTDPTAFSDDESAPAGFKKNDDYNKTLAAILLKKHVIGDSEEYYTLSGITNVIDSLTIGELIDTGDSEILNAIKNLNVTATESEFMDKINDLTIGQVINTEGSKILEAIADVKIGDPANEFEDAIDKLTLGDVVDTSASEILGKLSTVQIGAGSQAYIDKIAEVRISDFLKDTADEKTYTKWRTIATPHVYSNEETMLDGYEENPDCSYVLNAIYTRNGSIGALDETLNDLKLGEVIKDANDSTSILYPLKDFHLNELDGNTMSDNIKVEAVFQDQIYEENQPHTPQHIKGIWKYLLKGEDDPSFTDPANEEYAFAYKSYTLSDMSEMMDNFERNMQSAKLRDLQQDGIISMNHPEDLEKSFPIWIDSSGKKLGDYTFSELMDMLRNIVV